MNEHASQRDEEAPPFAARLCARVKVLLGFRQDSSIREAIEEVLEEHESEGAEALPPEEHAMLRNVLSFGEITVHDIMMPRSDIMAVPLDCTMEQLKQHIIEQRHTRIPVYSGSLDHVEGFLHIKDLFAVMTGDQPYELRRVMRPMLFVPPSMKVIDLLVKMRRASSHMAIVVDEYGGTDGLVTLEDVFEEIVGEIQDEHDDEDGVGDLVRTGGGKYEADARLRVERLEQELNVVLRTDEQTFDTLGGLLFFELGRVPSRGELVTHPSGLRFEILEADPRRIKRVRIMQQAARDE